VSPAVELRAVSKSYGLGRRRKLVVSECSLDLEENATSVMIGPSGAGKSSLVRLIAGFEAPDSGSISMHGRPITGPSKDRLVMFQETALFPWLSARDNVTFGPRARGEDRRAASTRADALLGRFGLSAFADRYPAQLSGGMQRRAELARALLDEPALMILDEPFRGLDAMTKDLMLDYYATVVAGSPRTTLFVTTDVDEAIVLADRLLVMSHRPTRVAAVIDVDLPRPRTRATVMRDDRANQIKARALDVLDREGRRAFAAPA
jgi:sulfonate transport system ATP-binding protein